MGKSVIVIGAQWGDEGKGKIVDLLTERAAAVVRFLVSRGVDPVRLVAVGSGDTRPKAPNRDGAGQPIPESQSENRRVEIEIER